MRKLAIVVFCICLAMCGAVYATSYYVANDGNNSHAGTSPETAWQTVGKVNGTTFTSSDTVYFKRGGVWSDASLIMNNGNGAVVDAYGAGPLPKITIASPAYAYNLGANSSGTTNIRINHINFVGGILINNTYAAATTVTFDSCIFQKYFFYFNSYNTTIPIYNSIFSTPYPDSFGQQHFYFAHDDVVVLKNNIIAGISGGGGKVANKGQIQRGWNIWTQTPTFSGYSTTRLGPEYVADPQLVKTDVAQYPTLSSLSIHIDGDYQYTDYYAALINMLNTYFPSIKLTWFVVTADLATGATSNPTQDALIQSAFSSGHEIAIHTEDHTALDITSGFKVTTTNTTPTINVDPAAMTLTLSCDQSENIVTVDWSSTSKTIADLKSAVAGKAWTITNTAGNPTSCSVKNWLPLSVLASTGGAVAVGSGSTGYVALLNRTGAPGSNPFFDYEILQQYNYLYALTRAYPTTIAYPGGFSDSSARAYCRLLGLKAGRSILSGGSYPTSAYKNFDLFNTRNQFIASYPANFTADAKMQWYQAKYLGTQTGFYTHMAGERGANTSDAVNNTRIWVQAALDIGARFMTYDQYATALQAHSSTSDNLTWTPANPAYASQLDARILSYSPALRSGSDLGATYDAGIWSYSPTDTQLGSRAAFGWNIGPYLTTVPSCGFGWGF